MSKLFNRAGVSCATAGTGTLTLGAAIPSGTSPFSCSYQTFATSGVADTNVVSYLILDTNGAWEYGTGTYTAAGTTLTRTLGQSSTGSLISLSGTSQVFVTARKEDLLSVSETQNANLVFAGPSSGGAATPTFRALVGADIPIALQSDQETATSLLLAVTPGRQQFHPSAPKYWQRTTVSAGTPTLQANYNVTSITDTATGRLTITINVDFSSSNWCNLMSSTNPADSDFFGGNSSGTMAAGSIELYLNDHFGTLTDPVEWHSVGLGDQ